MSEWKRRAFCKCGESFEASFGDMWFVKQAHPVCGKCGAPSDTFEMKTARLVSKGWFKGSEWQVQPLPAPPELP